MKIVHIITGLEDGGAEAVLYRLVRYTSEHEHHIISLSGRGKYGSLLKAAGVLVTDLSMKNSVSSMILTLVRLRALLRRVRPHVVQTWMYHADLIGGISARLAGVSTILWSLHHGSVSAQNNTRLLVYLIRTNALLSRLIPTKIVSCSRAAIKEHEAIGYSASKLVCIPNGHLIEQFRPDADARQAIRSEFGISPNTILFGMVARLTQHKDHSNLLQAIEILQNEVLDFKCVLVGTGLGQGSALRDEILARNLEAKVLLVGQRDDIPRIMNAFDIHVLSSLTEAFPNVLCEAMSCGTPCVTTDVGDSAFIVGTTGWVVPPKSPPRLSAALRTAAVSCRDSRLKDAARARIVENFSMTRMGDAYNNLWRQSLFADGEIGFLPGPEEHCTHDL